MVCKEDLCCWFKSLHPRKRIDYLCGLLHMCVPMELRFVGTVLEEKGKKDYYHLRNQEVEANKQSEIEKYKNISSPALLRAKILIALALMKSSSTTCAQTLYDIIESKLDTVFTFGPNDDGRVVDDVLTSLTLAVHHPAFMFHQRQELSKHLSNLENVHREFFRDNDGELPLGLFNENHIGHYHRGGPSQTGKVFVRSIQVLEPKKAADRKFGPEYRIIATWSNGEKTEVSKRFREIQEISNQLIEMFPDEKPAGRKIPHIPTAGPHSQQHSSREEHIKEQIQKLNSYFSALTNAPEHVLESELLCQFLKGTSSLQPAPPLPMLTPMSIPHVVSLADDEEVANAIPPNRPMTIRNSHLFYLTPNLNDGAGRLPRFVQQSYYQFYQPRFPPSHTCAQQPLLMPAHHMLPQQVPPPHTLLQPFTGASPPVSELSSGNTSPTGSRAGSPDLSTSVTQLLKLLGLEKYASHVEGLTVEQLSVEDLSKYSLPREAQLALRSKLEQICREKPAQLPNGIDGAVFPGMGHHAPSSHSSLAWPPFMAYAQYHPAQSAMSRSGSGIVDLVQGAVSESISGCSPPVSPGPYLLRGGLLGKAPPPGDSSEGSEDIDKSESLSEMGKSQGKSVQVKVSPNSEGRGSSSPLPQSSARMTPPGEAGSSKGAAVPMQPAMLHHAMNMYPSYHLGPAAAATHSQGLLVQPPDSSLLGGMPNNSNNNSYSLESPPIMSTGMPLRPNLLQGAQSLRGTGYKPSQPQPAHTNNMSLLQQKPGSPVVPMPYVSLRPSDMQLPMVAGNGMPQMDGSNSQRVPLFHLPFGRGGHGGPIASGHMPPVHAQTQPGVIPFSLVTRSVQTTMPGSASVMTVCASHPVTTVTASHSANSSSMNRSPSHNTIGGNGGSSGVLQRESSVEGITNAMSDTSLRSSPLQVAGGGMPQVSATPSPPMSVQASCQMCAQGSHYSHTGQYGSSVMYPYFFLHGPNGLIHQPLPSPYFPSHSGQPLNSLTNGYDMYYSQPAYPPTLNPGHMFPMMPGSSVYHPSQSTLAPTGGAPSVLPQSAVGAVGGAGLVHPGGGAPVSKTHNTGCHNCGSKEHRPGECPEISMEAMSGKAVYTLDFKPPEESDLL